MFISSVKNFQIKLLFPFLFIFDWDNNFSIQIKLTWCFNWKAGMQAVRENRYVVLPKDFEKGYKNNTKKGETEHEFYK